jgi:hypothetical protein
MTFDIASLGIQESTVLHLTHPANGEKLYVDKDGNMTLEPTAKPVTVTVGSTSSRAYRQAVNAMQNRSIKRGNKKMTPEAAREEGIELLTSICLGSENLVYSGAPVKSDSDFRALLADDKMSWVKAQIDEALGSVELFIA